MAIDFAEISFLDGGAAPKNFIISLVFLSFISSRSINFHVFLNIKFNFIKMLCLTNNYLLLLQLLVSKVNTVFLPKLIGHVDNFHLFFLDFHHFYLDHLSFIKQKIII